MKDGTGDAPAPSEAAGRPAPSSRAVAPRKGVGPRHEVLAAVADPATATLLSDYLATALGAGRALAFRGGVDRLIDHLEKADAPPRLVIVDLSGLDTPLSEMDRLAEACDPGVTVLAIGDRDSVYLFRELVRAGVADYLLKPVSPELLAPYVEGAQPALREAGQGARRGRLIAFAGARGGVGTTTLAVATAWRLSSVRKRRVALIDLDLHGGAAGAQLGVQTGGLIDALANAHRLDAVYLEQAMAQAGPRLALLADEAPLGAAAAIDPDALEQVLERVAEQYHFVVVDLPRLFGPVFAGLFGRARNRVIVTDRTLAGLRDGARLLDLAKTGSGGAMLALNDHHPGLRGAVDAALAVEALGRAPDFEIAYDRTAAQRGDNLGEPLAAGSGPIALAAERIVAGISGIAPQRPTGVRRLIASVLGRR